MWDLTKTGTGCHVKVLMKGVIQLSLQTQQSIEGK